MLSSFCTKNNILWKDEDGEQWFCMRDVQRVLESASIRQFRFPVSERRKFPCQTPGGVQMLVHISRRGLHCFLCSSRSPKACSFANALGMEVHNNLWLCIETDALAFLQTALSNYKAERQFYCKPYRIDLYFPDHRVAVECDEKCGHGECRVSDDHERQAKLESQLSCQFVRFRPQQPEFSLAALIHQVLCALQASCNHTN